MSGRPAYLLIAEKIRKQVEREQLKPGDRLPTERELVEEFGVARMTVRHALDLLQVEGLIERRRGRLGGTFLYSTPPVVDWLQVEGHISRVVAGEAEITTQIVELEKTRVHADITDRLRIPRKKEVWRVQRLKLRDDEPVMLGTYHFPCDIFPKIDAEIISLPLGEAMRERFDITPVYLTEKISMRQPSDEEYELLNLAEAQPLIQISRNTVARDGAVVEVSDAVMRPDIADIEIIAGRDPSLRGLRGPQPT